MRTAKEIAKEIDDLYIYLGFPEIEYILKQWEQEIRSDQNESRDSLDKKFGYHCSCHNNTRSTQ